MRRTIIFATVQILALKSFLCFCDSVQRIPFPKNFIQICKKILCRLFRVFVHVYIHHFDRILLMGAEAHVNTCYKHFYYFATELNLIDRKELEPLVRTEQDTHDDTFTC
ncbi:MOB kinase activator 3B [Labeo rohita]|uniref:MOB kinase activator 3B n=1 Tax=Labeo rohita TaxID=84645 RepID=A0ABQ8MQM7_LABRO|nr:MOB kinase activator 3B [Labeo rohita]